MTAPLVTYAVDGRVSIVSLDRPEKLNAIDADMKRVLVERPLYIVHVVVTYVSQKSRSVVRSFGLATVLLYTANCWREARFSRASCWWRLQRKGKSRRRSSRRVITELRSCPD